MTTVRRVAVVCAVGCAVIALRAQEPAAPAPPTFRAGTDLVQLDVTVLDRHRKPVRGLTASDFTILEDGKPQPVVAFVPVDLPQPPELPAPWMHDVAPDVTTNDLDTQRIVVIVMDDANSGTSQDSGGSAWSPWILKAGRRIATDVINSLGPQDLAAVVFTFMGRQQNLTTDHAKLLAAANSFYPKDSPSLGPPMGCSYKAQAGCVLDALKRIAETLPTSPPRRKVIVFVSQDVKIPDLDFTLTQTNSDAPSAKIDDLQKTLVALQRANVTIYAIDPGGLQTAQDYGKVERLQMLSELTGGRSFSKTNTPWEGVPQVFEETGSYYLLGFRTTRSDGQFHKVTVEVNRPDTEVRSRTGFYAPSSKPPKLAKKSIVPPSPVELALSGGMPNGDLSLTISAVAFAVPGQREADVAIVAGVHQPPPDGRTRQSIEILATAFDKEWVSRGLQRQTVEVTLRPAAEGDVQYELFSRLKLPPGRYEVRVAADSQSKIGSLFTDLEVPDFAKEDLAASGLVIDATPATISAPSRAFADFVPVVPTVRRTFQNTDKVRAFLRVYEGGKHALVPVRVSTTIVDESNKTVFETHDPLGPDRFVRGRAADVNVEIPVARLTPGEYLLALSISLDTHGNHDVTRTARFSVR